MDRIPSKDGRPEDRTAIANGDVDVQRGPVGTGPGYSGHEYDADGHAIDKALNAETAHPGDSSGRNEDAIPPDNGKRASFDRITGEVRGSGVGAGGGSEGEDFASDPAAGDGFPVTGRSSKP